MKNIICFLVAMVCLSFSCSKRPSTANVIPEEKFVHFYADLMIAREEGELLGLGSSGMSMRIDSVYRFYVITPDRMNSTIEYYKNDVNRWKDFHEKVASRLGEIQREATPPAKR